MAVDVEFVKTRLDFCRRNWLSVNKETARRLYKRAILHTLRHSFVIHLLDNGADWQKPSSLSLREYRAGREPEKGAVSAYSVFRGDSPLILVAALPSSFVRSALSCG